jgi:hypothetical protein
MATAPTSSFQINYKKVFFQKERAFLFMIGENDIKLTLKIFEFSYQNVEKYKKK